MTHFTGKNLLYYPELPSTNSLAMQLLDQPVADGTVVRTGHQTAGRGQRGNQWLVEPRRNLTLSVIYYPHNLAAQHAFLLSKVAALAVRDCVAACCPAARAEIKWPNDILLGRRKVAGILIETQLAGSRVQGAALGIGLNVNQLQFPAGLATPATSLALALGHALDLEGVADRLYALLESYYLRLRSGAYDGLDRSYLAHLYGYQEPVAVRIGERQGRYLLAGIDRTGRMALSIDGRLQLFDIKEAQIVIDP
ncbi:MAG: hypothetical protein OHK0039_21640 [Bacteroidia bacterium]